MTSLHQFLREISSIGPHKWDQITPDDFGFDFDYITQTLGESRTIIDPTSRAALEWLYKSLPEHCPRYGKLGFVVENEYVQAVCERMRQEKLISEAEYVENMNENDALQHQGEKQ